ncbi:hypothetical protein LJC15_00105 [Desulfovibrio sp. OttesenSCG-928-G11]|nr:hypothetical protein [Desulfovibrio sp. OttesenSCG-928-G11]
MQKVFFVLLASLALLSSPCFAAGKGNERAEVSGIPNEYREVGMWFVKLVDEQGNDIMFVGARGLINDAAQACLDEAMEKESRVLVSGPTITHEDGSKAFDEAKITCKAQ